MAGAAMAVSSTAIPTHLHPPGGAARAPCSWAASGHPGAAPSRTLPGSNSGMGGAASPPGSPAGGLRHVGDQRESASVPALGSSMRPARAHDLVRGSSLQPAPERWLPSPATCSSGMSRHYPPCSALPLAPAHRNQVEGQETPQEAPRVSHSNSLSNEFRQLTDACQSGPCAHTQLAILQFCHRRRSHNVLPVSLPLFPQVLARAYRLGFRCERSETLGRWDADSTTRLPRSRRLLAPPSPQIPEAWPIVVPVTFACCFGVYSLAKKAAYDPEVQLSKDRRLEELAHKELADMGHDLINQRRDRASGVRVTMRVSWCVLSASLPQTCSTSSTSAASLTSCTRSPTPQSPRRALSRALVTC